MNWLWTLDNWQIVGKIIFFRHLSSEAWPSEAAQDLALFNLGFKAKYLNKPKKL